jgi:hypothetical protein
LSISAAYPTRATIVGSVQIARIDGSGSILAYSTALTLSASAPSNIPITYDKGYKQEEHK